MTRKLRPKASPDPRQRGNRPWETRGRPFIGGQIDVGIRKAVERFQASGIETFESCEGGPGHSYPEPTVAFGGSLEAGWRAVGICFAYGLPIKSLRRVWKVLDRCEPTGPTWEITFRERLC